MRTPCPSSYCVQKEGENRDDGYMVSGQVLSRPGSVEWLSGDAAAWQKSCGRYKSATKSYLLKHTVRSNRQSATRVIGCDLEAIFTRNALMSDHIVPKQGLAQCEQCGAASLHGPKESQGMEWHAPQSLEVYA